MTDNELDGILPVDKPEGPTSHDIVARARRALGIRRIGHTGTLDPFASGLLLLCVGRSTRLAEYLTGLDKTYRAVARLGASTDTDDRAGTVLATSEDWSSLTPTQVEAALHALEGPQLQVPPAYSAKKVAGERMYERARRGEAVVLSPVPVTVRRIEMLGLRLPDVELEIECSSGTYIRALARDLGERLGVGAHLTALRRTRIGAHDIGTALPAERLDDLEAVRAAWIGPAEALRHLPRVDVSAPQAVEIGHGGPIFAPDALGKHEQVVVCEGGELIAIAESTGGMLRPRKVFR
ncbi:MAG TPA: tRNA pseudouridine(55) synthase TruB [Longimicrobiales bacterium]